MATEYKQSSIPRIDLELNFEKTIVSKPNKPKNQQAGSFFIRKESFTDPKLQEQQENELTSVFGATDSIIKADKKSQKVSKGWVKVAPATWREVPKDWILKPQSISSPISVPEKSTKVIPQEATTQGEPSEVDLEDDELESSENETIANDLMSTTFEDKAIDETVIDELHDQESLLKQQLEDLEFAREELKEKIALENLQLQLQAMANKGNFQLLDPETVIEARKMESEAQDTLRQLEDHERVLAALLNTSDKHSRDSLRYSLSLVLPPSDHPRVVDHMLENLARKSQLDSFKKQSTLDDLNRKAVQGPLIHQQSLENVVTSMRQLLDKSVSVEKRRVEMENRRAVDHRRMLEDWNRKVSLWTPEKIHRDELNPDHHPVDRMSKVLSRHQSLLLEKKESTMQDLLEKSKKAELIHQNSLKNVISQMRKLNDAAAVTAKRNELQYRKTIENENMLQEWEQKVSAWTPQRVHPKDQDHMLIDRRESVLAKHEFLVAEKKRSTEQDLADKEQRSTKLHRASVENIVSQMRLMLDRSREVEERRLELESQVREENAQILDNWNRKVSSWTPARVHRSELNPKHHPVNRIDETLSRKQQLDERKVEETRQELDEKAHRSALNHERSLLSIVEAMQNQLSKLQHVEKRRLNIERERAHENAKMINSWEQRVNSWTPQRVHRPELNPFHHPVDRSEEYISRKAELDREKVQRTRKELEEKDIRATLIHQKSLDNITIAMRAQISKIQEAETRRLALEKKQSEENAIMLAEWERKVKAWKPTNVHPVDAAHKTVDRTNSVLDKRDEIEKRKKNLLLKELEEKNKRSMLIHQKSVENTIINALALDKSHKVNQKQKELSLQRKERNARLLSSLQQKRAPDSQVLHGTRSLDIAALSAVSSSKSTTNQTNRRKLLSQSLSSKELRTLASVSNVNLFDNAFSNESRSTGNEPKQIDSMIQHRATLLRELEKKRGQLENLLRSKQEQSAVTGSSPSIKYLTLYGRSPYSATKQKSQSGSSEMMLSREPSLAAISKPKWIQESEDRKSLKLLETRIKKSKRKLAKIQSRKAK